MNISSAIRGYNYPTHLKQKSCLRFHRCIASNKCQNYDQHNRECFLCEQRVYQSNRKEGAMFPLGGKLAEGAYQKDIQAAIARIQKVIAKPMIDLNSAGQKISSKELHSIENYRKDIDTLTEQLNHKGITYRDDDSD